MSRIRTIKPEFWTSAQVLECSTNVRLLFLGLWNFCDDKGRHPASPKQVKAEVFPADPFTMDEIQTMLDELAQNDLIRFYVHENTTYFYVTGWKHQRIDKPQDPKYPDPFDEHSQSIPRTIPPDTILSDRILKDIPLNEDAKGLPLDDPEAKKEAAGIEPPAKPLIRKKPEYSDHYELVWDCYKPCRPMNASKSEAWKSYEKLDEEDRDKLCLSLTHYMDWLATQRKGDPKYPAKHLVTYINQRSWEPFEEAHPEAYERIRQYTNGEAK